jgi:hypothetical protein
MNRRTTYVLLFVFFAKSEDNSVAAAAIGMATRRSCRGNRSHFAALAKPVAI